MKTIALLIFFIFPAGNVFSQLPQTKVVNGTVMTVEPGMLAVPGKEKYKSIIDSLDKNLKQSPNDTTSLFYRALLYNTYNQMQAAPYQLTKGTLEHLTIAKDMIEKALANQMKDFRAKLLRAQIYSELSFRFTGDESWMFNSAQILARKKLFNTYKEKTNEYYTELGKIDPKNEYDYTRKKISYNYPIK